MGKTELVARTAAWLVAALMRVTWQTSGGCGVAAAVTAHVLVHAGPSRLVLLGRVDCCWCGWW